MKSTDLNAILGMHTSLVVQGDCGHTGADRELGCTLGDVPELERAVLPPVQTSQENDFHGCRRAREGGRKIWQTS